MCAPPHPFQARIYDVLFRSEDPASSDEWLEDMNGDSLQVWYECVGSVNGEIARLWGQGRVWGGWAELWTEEN